MPTNRIARVDAGRAATAPMIAGPFMSSSAARTGKALRRAVVSTIAMPLALPASLPAQETHEAAVDRVNPLMGTESGYELSCGNSYPAVAVAVPWGMNFWSPVTGKMGNGWGHVMGAAPSRRGTAPSAVPFSTRAPRTEARP